MTHDDKQDFYSRMGFCECNNCARLFYDYDEYEQHKCDYQGIIPPNDYTIQDDTARDV